MIRVDVDLAKEHLVSRRQSADKFFVIDENPFPDAPDPALQRMSGCGSSPRRAVARTSGENQHADGTRGARGAQRGYKSIPVSCHIFAIDERSIFPNWAASTGMTRSKGLQRMSSEYIRQDGKGHYPERLTGE
jgi:hypothetical protein